MKLNPQSRRNLHSSLKLFCRHIGHNLAIHRVHLGTADVAYEHAGGVDHRQLGRIGLVELLHHLVHRLGEGKLLTHHIDRAALTLMSMQSVIEKDYHPIHADLPMGKLVAEISRSNNNFLPVVDKGGVLLGVIDITRIRHIIFRSELYTRFKVKQLMLQPSAVLSDHEPMQEVMKKFDETDAAQLPVVDVNGVLKGYISRTRLYSTYRQIVADMSAE